MNMFGILLRPRRVFACGGLFDAGVGHCYARFEQDRRTRLDRARTPRAAADARDQVNDAPDVSLLRSSQLPPGPLWIDGVSVGNESSRYHWCSRRTDIGVDCFD